MLIAVVVMVLLMVHLMVRHTELPMVRLTDHLTVPRMVVLVTLAGNVKTLPVQAITLPTMSTVPRNMMAMSAHVRPAAVMPPRMVVRTALPMLLPPHHTQLPMLPQVVAPLVITAGNAFRRLAPEIMLPTM
jgi:hypothetical protein